MSEDKFNHGIEYKPVLDYDLGEIPASDYSKEEFIPENYITPQRMKKGEKVVEIEIDFLIYKAEEQLSQHEGFDQYKKAAVNKYYCQEGINNNQSQVITEFKNLLGEYQKKSKAEIYERLLLLKRNLDKDMNHTQRIEDREKEDLQKKINYLNDKYSGTYIDWDFLDYEIDENNSEEMFNKLNDTLKELKDKTSELEERYDRAVDDDDPGKARKIRQRIEDIKKDINDIKESFNLTATESKSLYNKIDKTNNFLKKAGYILLATPFDRLGDTVCCFIKLLIEQLNINKDKVREYDKKIEDFEDGFFSIGAQKLSLEELISTIQSLKTLVYIMTQKEEDLIKKTKDKLMNIAMAPIDVALDMSLNILKKLEMEVVVEIESLFKNFVHGDPKNPESPLDCLYFESFADLIYNGIENIFDEMYDKLTEYHKITQSYTNSLFDNEIHIYNEDKLVLLYKILSVLEKSLKTIEDTIGEFKVDNIEGTIEDWIEGLLIDNGFGTTYNPQTGSYENIDLKDCIDLGSYDGKMRDFKAKTSDDIPTINLNKNQEYRDFVKEEKSVDLECELDLDEEEFIKMNEDELEEKYRQLIADEQKMLEETNKNIEDINDKDLTSQEAKDFLEDFDLNYS